MIEKKVTFDADVYRRLEFWERRHNEIVDETFGARLCATAFAGVSLCIMIFIVVWTLIFPLLPTPETPSASPANVGELVKTLKTVDPETPLEKKRPETRFAQILPAFLAGTRSLAPLVWAAFLISCVRRAIIGDLGRATLFSVGGRPTKFAFSRIAETDSGKREGARSATAPIYVASRKRTRESGKERGRRRRQSTWLRGNGVGKAGRNAVGDGANLRGFAETESGKRGETRCKNRRNARFAASESVANRAFLSGRTLKRRR